MKKAINQSKLFIVIGLILTLLQLLFDTLNVSHFSEQTTVIIGASPTGPGLTAQNSLISKGWTIIN